MLKNSRVSNSNFNVKGILRNKNSAKIIGVLTVAFAFSSWLVLGTGHNKNSDEISYNHAPIKVEENQEVFVPQKDVDYAFKVNKKDKPKKKKKD